MFESLYDAGRWAVGWWSCAGHDHGEATEHVRRHEVVVPIRGAYRRERAGAETIVTAHRAVLADRGDSYRVSHPVPGGDECLVFLLDEPALEDLGRATDFVAGSSSPRFRRHELAVPPALFIRAARLRQRSAGAAARDREGEAGALLTDLLASAGGTAGTPTARAPTPATAARHRRAVARGAAFIAANYRASISLDEIASSAAYSPFYFARTFRRVMGLSIHRYVIRLRLRDAATQILDGERDLSALALRLGFTSHSHMTAAFRAEFGRTPSSIRAGFR